MPHHQSNEGDMTAGQLLKDWLDKIGRKHRHFANQIGITPGYLSKIINGKERPSFDLAQAIAKETRNAVPLTAWGRAELAKDLNQ